MYSLFFIAVEFYYLNWHYVNDKHFKNMKKTYFGLFYSDPANPLFFVKKENGLGWTINFGHQKLVITLIGILILVISYFLVN